MSKFKFLFFLITAFLLNQQCFANESGSLKATIIGSGEPNYNPQRSGPAVLISYNDEKILVDMGNGTQARLFELGVEIKDIDTFMFTHHHLDHNEEFIPIFINRLKSSDEPFTIIGPKNTKKLVEFIYDWYEEDINYRLGGRGQTLYQRKKNIAIKDIKGGDAFDLNGLSITTTNVNHSIETIAYRYQLVNKSIVITGDLTYTASLPELAQNTNILIMDAGRLIRKKDGKGPGKRKKKGPRAHATIEEVTKMATESNAETLVLTHIKSVKDWDASRKAIKTSYRGKIIFATDLMEIQ